MYFFLRLGRSAVTLHLVSVCSR